MKGIAGIENAIHKGIDGLKDPKHLNVPLVGGLAAGGAVVTAGVIAAAVAASKGHSTTLQPAAFLGKAASPVASGMMSSAPATQEEANPLFAASASSPMSGSIAPAEAASLGTLAPVASAAAVATVSATPVPAVAVLASGSPEQAPKLDGKQATDKQSRTVFYGLMVACCICVLALCLCALCAYCLRRGVKRSIGADDAYSGLDDEHAGYSRKDNEEDSEGSEGEE